MNCVRVYHRLSNHLTSALEPLLHVCFALAHHQNPKNRIREGGAMPVCRCQTNAVGDGGVLPWAAVVSLCLMCFAAGYLVGVYRPPNKSPEKRRARTTACTQTVDARMPSAQTAVEGTGEVDPMHCAPAAAADDASQADDSNCCGAGEGDGAAVDHAGMGIASSQGVSQFQPEGVH